MGKMYIKQQIVQENPELVLSENGDFIIDKSLVDKYEIIDVHCHLFKGLAHLFPAIFQKEKNNTAVSLIRVVFLFLWICLILIKLVIPSIQQSY